MADPKVSDLIRDIRTGEFTLPEFQRGYVWNRQQVRGYLRSLYRAYPTGSFLIWKTPHPPKMRGELIDEARFYQLILDGQQRLTSLYALLEGEPPPFYEGEKLFFNLQFDLVSEEFKYYKPSEMKGKPQWVAVTPFFKRGLAGFLQDLQQADEATRQLYYANMDKLTSLERIKDYTYHILTLNETKMDRVVEIFNLVNSSGTELSKSDLALAHICSLWPEAREAFRKAKAEYAQSKFDLKLDFFTRCTSIVATGSALYEPLYRTPISDVKAAWPKVTRALEYVLNVLRADAFIDDAETFPSQTVMVPLVSYLALTNRDHFESERQKRSFLHWMYAAMMWGRYSGSSETKLQADIEALGAVDPPTQLRENLIAERGRIKVEAKDLEDTGAQSPFYPMAYIVARSRGAVDWFRGTALYQKAIGQSFGLEAHHIFPQSLLYRTRYSSLDRADKRTVNEIANLVFLTKRANIRVSNRKPESYLPDVLAKYPDALKQQAVPMSVALWKLDQYETFLAERRRLFAQAINELMDSLLEAGVSSKTMTIRDFIARGEGVRLEFKMALRWDHHAGRVSREIEKSIARTLAGFMNVAGGTLVVGVTDSGEIVGVQKDMESLGQKQNRDGLALQVTNLLSHYLGEAAAASVDVSFAELDDKVVLVLSAPAATAPVFVLDGDASEFYVRAQASTRRLDVKEATEHIDRHWPSVS